MGYIWTLAEHRDGVLKQVSFELLAWAGSLAEQLETKTVSVVIGSNFKDEDLQQLIWQGADIVYCIEDPQLEHFTNETYSNILADLINEKSPHTVLAAATSYGRTVMPYVAIKVKTGLTADCTDLTIDLETKKLVQTRPAIGGNVMATIKTPHHMPQMATVRPKSLAPLLKDKKRKGSIRRLPLKEHLLDRRSKVVGFRHHEEGYGNIEEAEYIVAGGNGLKKAANFTMLKELADIFKGAVGASREAVDQGWVSYSHQIGLSGKTVSPRLYIAVGISGSVQHLAGIKTAEHIVAVNSDLAAPILAVADYGIAGDLFIVVSRMIEKLKHNNNT